MIETAKRSGPQILLAFALVLVLGLGLWLRWRFVSTVSLYPDEFVTLLAVEMIRENGAPIMPSGLFYDHGLLFSYLGGLVVAGSDPATAVRLLSLFCGGLTIGLTYWVGQRWYSPGVGLIAAIGLSIAPAAIEWSGRARMYALLQLLVLLTMFLAYEGVVRDQARLRWSALLVYLAATLTQFAAVALAPPLVIAVAVLLLVGAWGTVPPQSHPKGGRKNSLSQRERDGVRAPQSTPPKNEPDQVRLSAPWLWTKAKQLLPELTAFTVIVLTAFLIKRLGQPKGIEALDPGAPEAITGLWQVLTIYGDLSFNLVAGWQAVSTFFLDLPALIFSPFALIAALWSLVRLYKFLRWSREQAAFQPSGPPGQLAINNEKLTSPSPHSSTLFLSLVLGLTTLEIILLVSPDRRDDKYLFMLLPGLLLLGAQGMALIGTQFARFVQSHTSPDERRLTNNKGTESISNPPIFRYQLLITLLVSICILTLTWPSIRARLANTGDDYAAAFAYVQDHWRKGDRILTGTPAAAYFYLGRNDFYSVQRRGGYDYRLLTLDGQAVDRWLGSPALRTEAELYQTLAAYPVWLVLERWGLQREYYDLPFQQQLLAQTELVSESQGIFVLKSRPNPQPIRLEPDHPAPAVFADLIALNGYTAEPEPATAGESLRLTLYWQAVAPMPHDYTVFVHLRSADGLTLAQADHRPLGNLFPTSLWPAGETIRETSDLPLPADLSAGRYELWTGLYRLETLERLPLKNDTSGENAFRLGALEVK